MSYHLNIFYEKDQDKKFSLEDILSIIKNIDSNYRILETNSSIKTFEVLNLIKLHYVNGVFWSIYETEEKLQILVKFINSNKLIVLGEEGEIYFDDGKNISVLKPKENRNYEHDFFYFIRRNKISIFVVLLFSILAIMIGEN